MCEQLRQDGHEDLVRRTSGLRLDPYFSATKLAWVKSNEPHIWSGVTSGRTAIGTVDSYLVARMSRGLHHVTDASNASRTLLFDIHRGAWSDELCALFGVPMDALPTVVPSYGDLAHTDPSCFLGLDLPITGIAGDQQAALFGQCAFAPGDAKCTYGTGSFVLVNTGADAVSSHAGLLTTVAYGAPDGSLTYALEGSVFVTGAAIQWLRDGLGVIDAAHEVNDLAASVPDAGGVVFVPALAGLGAPDWDPVRPRRRRRHHPRHDGGPPGQGHPRRHRLPGARRDRPDGGRGVAVTARSGGGRRCQRQRPALPAAGRPARRAGAASGDDRDHRSRGGVPRRAGSRGLGVPRRADRLSRHRPHVHPGPTRRARSPALAGSGGALQGLGPRDLSRVPAGNAPERVP